MSNMARKSRGRQKIEMTRLPKGSNLLVTFSKRRSGLFKKASELCTLCGAEIAILVFSPGKKVFSFGHPSVEFVVDRYLKAGALSHIAVMPPSPSTSTALQLVQEYRSANAVDLNVQLNHVLGLLEEEERRAEELSRLRKEDENRGERWWKTSIEDMGLEELERLKEVMEDLRKKASWEEERVTILEAAAAAMAVGRLPPTYVGVAPPSRGDGGLVVEANIPAADLGQLSVTPHGYTLGVTDSVF